ncbi:MAG TPA: PP2C family protein-serine/threonine phosphatase [Thermoanaerobaculia bacterium]|nr:PP2C family protein-serine/threonine phosphatase [Thermoanaerobaculia bacterium]
MVSPSELSEVIIASLILAMGLIAVVSGAWRSAVGDRTPIWFGLFGLLYGARLAGHSELVQPFLPELFWRYQDAFITYTILVPGGLFIESLFGPGWRCTLRRTWQAAAVYASLAIAHDLVRGQPGATLWLNRPVVLIAGGIVAAHVLANWWRESWPGEFRVAVVGGLLFLTAATYQTLGGEVQLEPLAMLIFMTSVGYLVVQRMLAGERRLVAVSRELELAREIQQSLLPRTLPEIAGLRVAARYLPMSAIGGDFYDFAAQQPHRLGVIVADVTGHGVPAALVASMVKIAFVAEADRLDRPAEALSQINRALCGRFKGAFVTACCAAIDTAEGRLRYASAGHPAPLLLRRDGHLERLDQRGLLLAFDPRAQYAMAEVSLGAGDRLLFFSDGLLEAANAADELFGDVCLERLLVASAASTPERLVEQILADLRRWVGPDAEFQDDVTIVVVDVGEAP